MEIDQLGPPTTEEQMEMMLMKNMDIDLPDFYRSPNDEFTTFTNTISAVPTQFIDESPPAFVSLANSRISLFSGCGGGGGDINNSPNIQNPLPRWRGSSTTGGGELSDDHSHKKTSMAVMREMIFRIAAMQPIHIDPESVKPPKRRNVKISKDPQSVAARHRRERISERIRILQRLVPGGTKMDTASMLDEAIHYVKFLKNQLKSLESISVNNHNRPITSTNTLTAGIGFPVAMSNGSYVNPLGNNKPFHHHHHHHHQPSPSNQPHQGLHH